MVAIWRCAFRYRFLDDLVAHLPRCACSIARTCLAPARLATSSAPFCTSRRQPDNNLGASLASFCSCQSQSRGVFLSRVTSIL